MRDKMKKDTPRKTATAVMMWIKCSISMLMGVRRTLSSDARVAIRPITVRSPVAMTMPRAVPGRGGGERGRGGASVFNQSQFTNLNTCEDL